MSVNRLKLRIVDPYFPSGGKPGRELLQINRTRLSIP
jgi:hypothetical protein